MDSKSSDNYPYQRQKRRQMQRGEEKAMKRQRQRQEHSHKLRDAWPPEAEKDKELILSPGDFRGSLALLTPWFWTSTLQNWEGKFLLRTSLQVCYSSHRKLVKTITRHLNIPKRWWILQVTNPETYPFLAYTSDLNCMLKGTLWFYFWKSILRK